MCDAADALRRKLSWPPPAKSPSSIARPTRRLRSASALASACSAAASPPPSASAPALAGPTKGGVSNGMPQFGLYERIARTCSARASCGHSSRSSSAYDSWNESMDARSVSSGISTSGGAIRVRVEGMRPVAAASVATASLALRKRALSAGSQCCAT